MFLRMILFLSSILFVPVDGILIVKIIRNSYYTPAVSCTLLRNISHSQTLQDCIWSCEDDVACRTSVYFNDEQRCSLFAEHHTLGQLIPSEEIPSSIIAFKKNLGQ
jgi:hypothetical protein